MLPELVSCSPSLRKIKTELSTLADSAVPLVIVGERGVGKTLLAKHIHAMGPRRKRRARVVNLHTLRERDQRLLLLGGGPPELTCSRRSVLEEPTTVLIKRIDEAARYIQESVTDSVGTGTLMRPGMRTGRPVRSRVIFTLEDRPGKLEMPPTLMSLLERCPTVSLPPLRERRPDLVWLVRKSRISAAGSSVLLRHTWPGNITELKGHLRSMVNLSHEEALREHERRELSMIINKIEEGSEFSLREALKGIEHHILARTLRSTGGRCVEAARLLGLTERDIRRKVSGLR
jgi:DNA-binding NtrC family response regulator